ncbi:MAG: Cof-type HAD-IIB family hydrolase [Treponema sp.]|nr:Cof-type HAD-IIB family hydrolase [Treponema sp.]
MSILPNPKKIKALALDLDGTLLGPGPVLSERTIRAVKGCRERGIKIIIATGRAILSAERFCLPLEAEGPTIYFNGALVADMPKAEILKITLLDKKAAEICLGLSREMGVYYHVFLPGNNLNPRITLVADRDTPDRDAYFKHTGIMAELADLEKVLRQKQLKGLVKSMFLAEPEILEEIRLRLNKLLGNSVYAVKSSRTFLEIMNKNVSKGRALQFVMKRLSLKKEEVIAFGDEENDLPMFSTAGFSAAPSNAKDAVKRAAGLVIGSNADDGVAAFLEEFILSSSP